MSAQLATFCLGPDLFGIPVGTVQEVLLEQPRTPAPGAPAAIAGLINLRGQVVTALDLRTRVGLPPRPADLTSIDIVVRAQDEVWSLLADSIGDVVEVEDAQFEPTPDILHGPLRELLHGAYKLEDQLLLLLDVDRVLELVPAP